MNKTFCVYPWTHQMIDTNGAVKLCCVAEDPTTRDLGKHMSVKNKNLSELWNDPYMQSVRQRMLDGKQVIDCGQCYRKERRGEYSLRQKTNKDWANEVEEVLQYYYNYEKEYSQANAIKKETMQEYKHVNDKMPKYLDIRFGNLCNLKCRMCTGIYSKMLGEELEGIAEQDEEFRLLAPDSAKSYTFDWYENPTFWKDLEKYMPSVKVIYLTGGEPTLVQGNYEFLQQLIDKGFAQNISLVFNTNVTNFQQKFLDLINQFKKITLNLSIDGVEGVQEYIRYPSKWTHIQKNLTLLMKKVQESETKYDLVFTPTVSIINVANLSTFINWAYDFANMYQTPNVVWDMQPIFLHGPQFQDMIYATTDYRYYTLEQLDKVDQNALTFFKPLQRFYNEVKDTLKNKFENEPDSIMFRKQLHKWNTSIDNSRGIKIEDYIPYSKLLYE